MSEDTDGGSEAPKSAEEERIARAGRLGRRIGTIFMVLFGTWFVLTTVYNFAVNVFGQK